MHSPFCMNSVLQCDEDDPLTLSSVLDHENLFSDGCQEKKFRYLKAVFFFSILIPPTETCKFLYYVTCLLAKYFREAGL